MSSPVFAHGHLRLYLLGLLQSTPMHGYELILALQERFGGTYTPSAGTIYPRLAKLENEGLVSKSADGRKTVYAITDAGRAEVVGRQQELDEIENDVTDSVRRLADEVRSTVDQAMKSLRAELAFAREEGNRMQAAARPTGQPTAGVDSPRASSAARLREAESALDEFRHRIRTDLHIAAARGELSPNIADLLRSRLDAVRADFLGTLN